MAYDWTEFTDYLDGTRPITAAERNELWDALDALLTRCTERYQVNTLDRTAIEQSLLVTDRTSLDDLDIEDAKVRGRLVAVLSAIDGTFTGETVSDAFEAAAVDEEISSGGLAEILSTDLETYHLWNLYKRVLDRLSCCPTGVAAVQYDSISASKTKCGYSQFAAASADPEYDADKRYLVRTIDKVGNFTKDTLAIGNGGTPTCCDRIERNIEDDWNFSIVSTFNTTTCLASDSESGAGTHDDLQTETFTAPASDPSRVCESDPADRDLGSSITVAPEPTGYASQFGGGSYSDSTVTTPLVQTRTVTGSLSTSSLTPDANCTQTGNSTDAALGVTETSTYSSEYTDEILAANVAAAMPAPDDDFNDTAGAFLYVSPDGLTRQERRARWREPLPTGRITGRTYDLIYIVRFSPYGGGANVDGAEQTLSTTWNGTDTHTAVQTVPMPTENGTNIIVPLRWECPDEA